uniref:Uncharacterized protein n=1 Tax=Rhizophora mucronata TaxID=61149 RepID=A0A2P2P535_RHIMU
MFSSIFLFLFHFVFYFFIKFPLFGNFMCL